MSSQVFRFFVSALAVGVMVPFAHAKSPERTVSVTGTAVTKVTPDIAVWTITTTDFDKKLKAAKQSSDENLRNVLEAIDTLGVEDEDVQTGHLQIRKEYERLEHGEQGQFKHFRVTRSVTFRQRDLSVFDAFLTDLVARTEFEAFFRFESSEYHELREQTRIKAVQLAHDKAASMAEALGAKLGQVSQIIEPGARLRGGFGGGGFGGGGGGFGGGGGIAGIVGVSNALFTADGATLPDQVTGTLRPGSIEIRVTVYVVFELR